ncbi:MAG: response regulator [Clostridiales bacterium]|jgi:two-component system LytT family response regulator|nr:response regulator [Clostridiales bacterium]
MRLRALIVDDEYLARQELRFLLGQFKDIEIVGEAASANEALKLIQALEYDVLFLDINLPGISGVELALKIHKQPNRPEVIFTTAYENYALDAFSVNAVDYILKPVSKPRLGQAIDKLRQKKSETSAAKGAHSPAAPDSITLNRIIAESGGRMVLVDVDKIYYAFMKREMVYIKTFEDEMLTRFTLKELEAKLGGNFFRSHRSYIVNIQKVKEILPFFNGTSILVMEDKEKSEIPVSRNQSKKLRKLLGK